jgi:predicted metal-dependent hydrolase
MIGTYEKHNQKVSYKIVFKPIKHVYFRRQSDYILISANLNMSTKQVLNILDMHFEKLVNFQKVNKRQTTNEFQLWGEVLTPETYFKDDQHTTKNYQQILIDETVKKIDSFKEKLSYDLKRLNLELMPNKVKLLKSKFGSCQVIKKEITINAFLAKLDPVYLYYVLLHEYCHLKVPNHSKAFYNLLDEIMPMHKSVQKALRKYVITF